MALTHDLCYSIMDIQLLLKNYDSYSSVLQYFNFVMSIVTLLVGLVVNAVVIFFLGFVMKKHKSRYWFLNLAIADFFFLLTLPIHTILALKGAWTFEPHICKLYLFSLFANMYASIYILIALNIARVLSVAKPMFHHTFVSQHVSFWTCILIWFIAILSTLPILYYTSEMKFGEVTICSFFFSAVVKNGYNVSSVNTTRDILITDIYAKLSPYIQQCSSDTCCGGEETLHFWNHLMFTSKWFVLPPLILGYFIPLGIVIICNITIAVHVRKSKTINPHRLYRVILIIIFLYFITLTPLVMADTVLIVAIVKMNLKAVFSLLTFRPLLINIAYVNSALNPIVYVLNGGEMQRGLCDSIRNIRNKYK